MAVAAGAEGRCPTAVSSAGAEARSFEATGGMVARSPTAAAADMEARNFTLRQREGAGGIEARSGGRLGSKLSWRRHARRQGVPCTMHIFEFVIWLHELLLFR